MSSCFVLKNFIMWSMQCSCYTYKFTRNVLILCVFMWVPGQQYALILLQLSHKGGVWFGHSSTLLHVIVGFLQIPAVLLHGIRDHRSCRATYTHFTVHQALGSSFPAAHIKNQAYIYRLIIVNSYVRKTIQFFYFNRLKIDNSCAVKLTWL